MDEVTESGGNKGSKIKRKLSDPSIESPINLPSSLTEFPRYESSSGNSQILLNDLGSLARGPDSTMEEQDDPIVCQLQELLASNLTTLFHNAIKHIAECGYSEEIAEKAVSRDGLYYGGKDLALNIVNDTLAILMGLKGIDASRDIVFGDLQQLVEYTILEMISVLREVKPCLTIGEAMWWLLMFDLNILKACEVEGDKLSDFIFKEELGESSSNSTLPQLKSEDHNSDLPNPNEHYIPKSPIPNTQSDQHESLKFGSLPNSPKPRNVIAHEVLPPGKEYMVSMANTLEKFLDSTWECGHTECQSSASEEKIGTGRKGHNKKELAAIRPKAYHFEKNHRGFGKGAFKSGKLSAAGGFAVEKRMKSPSVSSLHTKSISSKISIEAGPLVPLAGESCEFSRNTTPTLPVTDNATTKPVKGKISALPAADTELALVSSSENQPAPKSEAIISETPKAPYFYARIPYDKHLGKYVPQDEKDEQILQLVSHIQELEGELQSWTQWTHQKVMQAAGMLRKIQPELKLLKQEKAEAEQYKKEKQILEENTMKRLSEIEFALHNATNQVERANSTVCRLEMEHSLLQNEMEAANLRAAESAASCQEALEREQKALKDAESLKGQMNLLEERLGNEKQLVDELQKKVSKAKNLQHQTEARWKQEKNVKEKLLAQAASIRKDRERLEASAKSKEDTIRHRAENNMQIYKEDIEKLEREISILKVRAESSKIAALRRGADGSYGSYPTDSKGACIGVFSRVTTLQDNFGTGRLIQDRECVMCLAEEKTVVFLPCAHQVLCTKCNEIHEKQGMKDCPSCRSPIQLRLQASFAHT
ncbi:zf-C3HC4_3 domain-containing protein [Cephalotus follicularis]|uniref:Zf-C3HC4_3 domain-containing protein n=1 Tax=Cephalotus follicularis TaxID=3775 RepID=A0A1Q3CJM5_CEPFO|nr:zf-C3HC4_3 domain-containing protein [Cephalotus follicularis]